MKLKITSTPAKPGKGILSPGSKASEATEITASNKEQITASLSFSDVEITSDKNQDASTLAKDLLNAGCVIETDPGIIDKLIRLITKLILPILNIISKNATVSSIKRGGSDYHVIIPPLKDGKLDKTAIVVLKSTPKPKKQA